MDGNESIKCIFELRSMIQKAYFKEFEGGLKIPVELNHTHIKTIMILKFSGESAMSSISDKLNLEKGSFTPVANNLIKRELVEKIPDQMDKRVFKLRLTEKGREVSSKISTSHITYVATLLESLSEEEKNLYFASIQLVNNMTKKLLEDKNGSLK